MLKIHQLSARDDLGSPLPDGTPLVADGSGNLISGSSSTRSYLFPSGTTAQRPTLGATVFGVRFNTDKKTYEGWNGVVWSSFSTSGIVPWTLPGSYESGQLVIYDGKIYQANADVAANSSFAEGTSGSTFSLLVGTGETWKGPYSAASTYGSGDVVSDGSGGFLVSLSAANTGNPLTNTASWAPYSPYVDLSALLAVMVGANGTLPGKKGLVPTPAATDNLSFLRGDGTWASMVSGSPLTEITETFVATAAQWQFNLAHAPNATELPNMSVGINGLHARYGTGTYFTVSGLVLSLLTAALGYNLIAGDRVTVTYKY